MKIKSTIAFVVACLGLAGCNTMPEKPAFEPSKSFDGVYHGTRTDVSNDFICKPTSITGTVENGEARFKLTYNNTNLKGWIDKTGQLTLYDDNSQWNYHFSGTATANAIEGAWSVDGAPCRGSWRVERQ